ELLGAGDELVDLGLRGHAWSGLQKSGLRSVPRDTPLERAGCRRGVMPGNRRQPASSPDQSGDTAGTSVGSNPEVIQRRIDPGPQRAPQRVRTKRAIGIVDRRIALAALHQVVAVRPQLQVRATRIDVDMRLLGAPAVVAIPLDPDCRRRRDGRRARRSRGHRLPGPMHGAQPVVGREGLAPLGPAYRHGPLLLRAGIRATGVNASAGPPGHASFRLIALAYPAK